MTTEIIKGYNKFLRTKDIMDHPAGLSVDCVNSQLFDFQRDITKWALKRGKACIFGDCGLGKTPIQLSWADEIHKTGRRFVGIELRESYFKQSGKNMELAHFEKNENKLF